MMMKINPEIFKAYDVRGIYKKDFGEEDFYELALVFGDYIGGTGTLAVGRDIRSSSSGLTESFIEGLLDAGFDVLDLGEVTTPMLYFAVAELKTEGGAMITASHNPPEYNGVKFVKKESAPIGGKEILEVYQRKNWGKTAGARGKIKNFDISSGYLDIVTKDFKLKRHLRISVDDGGGVVKLFLPELFKKLKLSIAQSPPFDFFISFDGDGDRLYVFDEKGEKINGDLLAGVIGDVVLKTGQTMVADMVSTRGLDSYFKEKGVIVKRSRVGHQFIKQAMRENEAVFASEFSGHYLFKELYYSDSALFAFRKLLEALNSSPSLTISELIRPFNKFFHSGSVNIRLNPGNKWEQILDKLKEKYKDGKQNFEDGLFVEYTDWWFNLRPSNTEPVVRLVVEAEDRDLMENKKQQLLKFLSQPATP